MEAGRIGAKILGTNVKEIMSKNFWGKEGGKGNERDRLRKGKVGWTQSSSHGYIISKELKERA